MPKNSAPHTRYILCAVVLVAGLMWSWLFGIRVAALSSSLIVGYLCTLFAFVVIVGLTAWVFLLTIVHFVREYQTKNPTARFLVRLFVVWSAVEFGVSVLVTIVWMGRNGSVDSVLPFGSFTPLLVFTPLRFLARLVGFHGLSAVFVVLTSVLAFKKLRKYASATVGLIVIGSVLAWALYRVPAGPAVNAQIVANHEGASDPLTTQSQLVVFPEYGLNAMQGSDIGPKLVTSGGREVFYVGSRRQEIRQGAQNVLVFGSTKQGVVTERAKTRLIPGGEYLPYAAELPLRLLRARTLLEQFTFTRAIEKGSKPATPLQIAEGVKLGSGVCASIIAPKDYRGLTKDGATVLTNSAALGVFDSPLFTYQHQGLARFMATANARPFLQSSSGGLGFALDHNGRLLKKISPIGSTEITAQTNHKITPYTILGEWPAYTGLVVIALASAKKLRKHKAVIQTGSSPNIRANS